MESFTSALAFLVFSITLLGLPVFFLGYLATLVQAFRKNLGWGFAGLFVLPILFLFTAVHWKDTRKSALMMYMGLVCYIGGLGLTALIAAVSAVV